MIWKQIITLIAVICSGVGATTLGPCGSIVMSWASGRPGVNVLTATFFASSSASFEWNFFAAATLSYKTERNVSQGNSETKATCADWTMEKTCQPRHSMVLMHLINENPKSKELLVCPFCCQHFWGPSQNIFWSHSKGNEQTTCGGINQLIKQRCRFCLGLCFPKKTLWQ